MWRQLPPESKGIRFPGAEVVSGWQLPDVDVGDLTWDLCKSSVLNNQVISVALIFSFSLHFIWPVVITLI